MLEEVLILNTGGTFNKKYNQIKGLLEVNNDSTFVNNILDDIYKSNKKPLIEGLIYKDSLDITKKDRKELLKRIQTSKYKKIIIIHGTDTMNKTAKFLNKNIKNKQIIIVGSMQPYTLSKIECTGNLMMAIGYINNKIKNNIYICMNGIVQKHNKIKKNYKKAVFEKYDK